jgi:glyoxylase-like metal-dependent hydrolase (beta-lactamase superfamily II)
MASDEPLEICSICSEERQYILPSGQHWITLEELIASNKYENKWEEKEQGIFAITTTPSFALGQTAYLIQTPSGNILWDCIAYLDAKTIKQIRQLGGIKAIALSHPHYYSTQVEWADTFDCPIFIHQDDQKWVQRKSQRIQFWSGETLSLVEECTMVRLGGHFRGGSVLHLQSGDQGKGVLFTGDIVQVTPGEDWVSFMYSYPNMIPLPAGKVKKIAEMLKDIPFTRIYGAFNRKITHEANRVVQKSAMRYIAALDESLTESR